MGEGPAMKLKSRVGHGIYALLGTRAGTHADGELRFAVFHVSGCDRRISSNLTCVSKAEGDYEMSYVFCRLEVFTYHVHKQVYFCSSDTRL